MLCPEYLMKNSANILTADFNNSLHSDLPAGKNLNYKLFYFNCRGYGEAIRLILHYKSIPFEEVRFAHFNDGQPDWMEKWKAFKPDFPYGQLPVLEFDDGPKGQRRRLCQSQTICRFLANKYGLAGKNEFEKAKADEIAEYLKDIRMPLAPFFGVLYGMEKGDLEEKRQNLLLPAIYEKFVPTLSRNLNQSGSGFLLPSGLSWADFFYVESCITFNGLVEGELFKKHPEFEEYVKRVHSANESVRKYVDGRPKMRL